VGNGGQNISLDKVPFLGGDEAVLTPTFCILLLDISIATY